MLLDCSTCRVEMKSVLSPPLLSQFGVHPTFKHWQIKDLIICCPTLSSVIVLGAAYADCCTATADYWQHLTGQKLLLVTNVCCSLPNYIMHAAQLSTSSPKHRLVE